MAGRVRRSAVLVVALVVLGSLSGLSSSSATAAPRPADSSPLVSNSLSGVSCPTPTFCVAVGAAVAEDSTPVALLEQWDGSAWRMVATPSQPDTKLSAVSCVSTAFCLAVGENDATSPPLSVVERWDGSSWTLLPAPASGQQTAPVGVSCPTATFCAAVGPAGTSANSDIMWWNGTVWSSTTTTGGLASVSCAGDTRCEAVGSDVSGAVAVGWDGSQWTSQMADPGSGMFHLYELGSVSCAGPDSCTAVGVERIGDPPGSNPASGPSSGTGPRGPWRRR